VKFTDLEVSDLLEFRIDTERRYHDETVNSGHTPAENQLIRDYAQELLEARKVRYSDSPWSANVVLVSKKDGGLTLSVAFDYRHLNSRQQG
jgi:hypothetical protein